MRTKNGTGESEHQLQKTPVHMQIGRGQTSAKPSKLNATQALRHSQMQMQHMQSICRGDCKPSPQISQGAQVTPAKRAFQSVGVILRKAKIKLRCPPSVTGKSPD